MNDRELLELAAKAADIKLDFTAGGRIVWDISNDQHRIWNPLEDDGDALRLAVNLSIQVDSDAFNKDTVALGNENIVRPLIMVTETHGDDPYAATRRAIVRAAAEIGKGASHG